VRSVEVVATLGGSAVLAAWLLLSVVAQVRSAPFDSLASAVRRRDQFGLIPNWSFFAPTPAMTDLHLLYRDRNNHERIELWSEFLIADTPRLLQGLWNPQKRIEKAWIDVLLSLLEVATRSPTAGEIVLSGPYLFVLQRISSEPRFGAAKARQFAVIQTGAHLMEPEILFVSNWHSLEGRVRALSAEVSRR
jgi:hypothetical protein